MSVTDLELHQNYSADSILDAGVNSSATSLVLPTGHGARFRSLAAGQRYRARLLNTDPADGSVISHEIVIVTAKSGDTLTVQRGKEGTTAVDHAAGTQVSAVFTAYQANRLRGYQPQPRANRLLAMSFDPVMAQRSANCLSQAGRVVLARCEAPEDLPITFFKTAINQAGVTLANAFAGVYDKAGTLLGKTANQATAWQSAGVVADATLTAEAGQSLTIPGGEDEYFYIGVLVGSQGTACGFFTTHAFTGLSNIGIGTTDPPRVGVSVDTGLTALPATINPNSRSSGGMSFNNDIAFLAVG